LNTFFSGFVEVRRVSFFAGAAGAGAAFFAPCLKVARIEDAAANAARRAAEEAAAYDAKALDGSWLTVFPIDGRWPKESRWAELHSVAFGDGGFAFASAMALKRVSARITKARSVREQNRRARAAKMALITLKRAVIKKIVERHGVNMEIEGMEGARNGDGRRKGGHASPSSVMMSGGRIPDYVAPDLTSLAQVAKSIEALLIKAKPRAHALVPSSRRAL